MPQTAYMEQVCQQSCLDQPMHMKSAKTEPIEDSMHVRSKQSYAVDASVWETDQLRCIYLKHGSATGCANSTLCTWLSKHVYVLSVWLPDLAPFYRRTHLSVVRWVELS